MENAQETSNLPSVSAPSSTSKPTDTTDSTSEADTTELSLPHVVSNLHLRKIIKENHGDRIHGLQFHPFCSSNAHMVVTSGKNQVNVYDNAHCGNHLDLCCHFVNEKTEYSQGGDVTSAIWLKGKEDENEAMIAFCATGGEIGVISMSNVRVTRLLKGHKGDVIDLCPHPLEVYAFYSLGTDGNVCRWTSQSDKASTVHVGSGSYCLCARGDRLLVGFKTGKIEEVDFARNNSKVLQPPSKGNKIICIRFMSDTQCITFSEKGVLQLVNLESGDAIRTMKLGGFSKTALLDRSSIDITPCGSFVCAGNPEGEVYIFNLATGKRVNVLSMPRIRAAVSACAFAPENRSILVSTVDGILWRWDYFVEP